MRLHRFCSQREFDAFMRGETIKNHTDHYDGGRGGSLSRGFCFFEGDIESWSRRLNGIVDFDVLLTVEVAPKLVSMSMGVYADWSKDDGINMPPKKHYREFCTESYDRRNFRFLSADHSFKKDRRFVSRSEILAISPRIFI